MCHHNLLIQVVIIVFTNAPVTPGLRPAYDLAATEKWWNRGQIEKRNERLVAEVVGPGDRSGKISRSKVDGHVQNF